MQCPFARYHGIQLRHACVMEEKIDRAQGQLLSQETMEYCAGMLNVIIGPDKDEERGSVDRLLRPSSLCR